MSLICNFSDFANRLNQVSPITEQSDEAELNQKIKDMKEKFRDAKFKAEDFKLKVKELEEEGKEDSEESEIALLNFRKHKAQAEMLAAEIKLLQKDKQA